LKGDALVDGVAKPRVRACPVCEETVPADTKVCPSCSTDLSLFPIDDSAASEAPTGDEDAFVADMLKQAEAETPAQTTQGQEMAECPACNKLIPADATRCSHCGVEFETADVFECPLCKSILEITVTKCPSCGAEFEDAPSGTAQEPEQPAQQASAPEPGMTEPQPEKPQPTSFADRLKQIREAPEAEEKPLPPPKREMSFAERMKAMKDGTIKEDDTVAPAPASKPPAQAPTAEPPAQQPKPKPQAAPVQAGEPQPAKGGQSITDRVQSLKQSAQPAQQPKPVQQPPAQQPAQPPRPAQQPPAQQQAPGQEPAKDGYKELPHHIAEVKRLLMLANDLKIDVSTSKALINKAVTAGKSRDLDGAIKMVKEGKAGLERDVRANMTAKLRTLESAVGLERKAGKPVAALDALAEDIRKTMEVGDFQHAWDLLKKLEEDIMRSSSGKLSQVELDTIAKAVSDAEALSLKTSEARTFLEEARAAIEAKDAQRSSQFAKQAMESLNKVLPQFVAGEIRKAKVTLRDIKMMNVDISTPVGILKEANDLVLKGDNCAALAAVRRFRDMVDRIKVE
jgi:RNA polymerase subunit RPABC4/transcription elongation factor Spt4